MKTDLSNIPEDLSRLDTYLSERESAYALKSGTEACIVWNCDSDEPSQTDYAIVYLHGFRASHPEGDPVHRTIAREFGYNLFLSRFDEHGLESDYPLLQLTEDKLLDSARFAIEMGRRIGKKIILMGTSTGGSLALYLAAQNEYRQDISSLILYSPLIRFYGFREKFLMTPFGRKSLELLLGDKYLIKAQQTTYAEDRIWYKKYALKGALALGSFTEHYMQKALFKKVGCPVFVGYYYKNNREQDTVVSVTAIKRLIKYLRSRTQIVKSVNFQEAKAHVICSSLVSNSIGSVIKETGSFLKNLGSQATSDI